ncbi:hypothetical protein V9T40_007398 [Parthenolecanium corni]|uniref:Uncharacterized protein n=1 Tax=Parthenolecanium corni TaxID=536013 RepID=A0AAN9YBZ4_9HEMI
MDRSNRSKILYENEKRTREGKPSSFTSKMVVGGRQDGSRYEKSENDAALSRHSVNQVCVRVFLQDRGCSLQLPQRPSPAVSSSNRDSFARVDFCLAKAGRLTDLVYSPTTVGCCIRMRLCDWEADEAQLVM